jgi:amino acid transporter
MCFVLLWVSLKILRTGQWQLVDLSNGGELAKKMLRLHEIRWRSAEMAGTARKGYRDLWGLL